MRTCACRLFILSFPKEPIWTYFIWQWVAGFVLVVCVCLGRERGGSGGSHNVTAKPSKRINIPAQHLQLLFSCSEFCRVSLWPGVALSLFLSTALLYSRFLCSVEQHSEGEQTVAHGNMEFCCLFFSSSQGRIPLTITMNDQRLFLLISSLASLTETFSSWTKDRHSPEISLKLLIVALSQLRKHQNESLHFQRQTSK